MKYRFVLIVVFLTTSMVCNCQILYHSRNLVTNSGDTINKQNGNQMYQGLHLITDNQNNLMSDTNYYLLGSFENGIPIGTWIEHKADGTFGKGGYKVSHETFKDDNNYKWITLVRGTGPKIGIWDYFTKDSLLIRKVLHEVYVHKNISTIKESIVDSQGKYNLLYYRRVKQKGGGSRFDKVLEIKNSEKGIPITINRKNFIRDLRLEYYENSKLKSAHRRSNIYNRYAEIQYNRKGKKIIKTVTKHYKRKIEGCPADFW